jgi:hypothetical protein
MRPICPDTSTVTMCAGTEHFQGARGRSAAVDGSSALDRVEAVVTSKTMCCKVLQAKA